MGASWEPTREPESVRARGCSRRNGFFCFKVWSLQGTGEFHPLEPTFNFKKKAKSKSTICSPPINKDLGSFQFPAYILEGCGAQEFYSGLGEFYPCLGPAGNGPRDVWLGLGLLFCKGRTQLYLSCWLSKSHLKLNISKANSIISPTPLQIPCNCSWQCFVFGHLIHSNKSLSLLLFSLIQSITRSFCSTF